MPAGERIGDTNVPQSGQTVTAQRTYAVSQRAAFDAWTNPASIEKWFGPPGFRAKVLTHDLRVGRPWRFLMYDGKGNDFHHFGTFVDIAPPCRLVFTWASEKNRSRDGAMSTATRRS